MDMDEPLIIAPLNLTVDAYELASIIRSLCTSIYNETYWSISPNHPWRKMRFEAAKRIINDATQAYVKAMMVINELADEHPDLVAESFFEAYNIPQEVWDVIDTVVDAASWEQVPVHRHGNCKACDELRKY